MKQKQKLKNKKKKTSLSTCLFGCLSDRALNLIGTEASRTDVDMTGRTVDDRLDALDIGLPCTIGTSMGVRDLNTKGNALAAAFTLSHGNCTSYSEVWNQNNQLDYFTRDTKKKQVFF